MKKLILSVITIIIFISVTTSCEDDTETETIVTDIPTTSSETESTAATDNTTYMCYAKNGSILSINCLSKSTGGCGSDGTLGTYSDKTACIGDYSSVLNTYSSTGNIISGPNSKEASGSNGNSSAFSYLINQGSDYVINTSTYNYSGILTASNLIDSETGVKVSKISFKYSFSSLFGEPLRSGIFMWNGSSGTNKISTITIKCKVMYATTGYFTNYYYTYSPIVYSTDGAWSTDVSGSPNWDKIFFNNSGTYMNASDAKSLYKSGFYLVIDKITELNGKTKN